MAGYWMWGVKEADVQNDVHHDVHLVHDVQNDVHLEPR